MAVGFTALVILKKAIRSVPVMGPLTKPLLGELTLAKHRHQQ
jgi:hypothetical protein